MKTTICIILVSIMLTVNICYSQNFEWAIGSAGTEGNMGWASDADASGNVYSTGHFQGSMTLGNQTLTSLGGSRDIYVAKHNSAGVLQWSNRLGGAVSYDIGYNIACSGNGDVYVLGEISWDLYLIKYNSNGVIQWSENVTNGNHNCDPRFNQISIDNSGNCYIAGSFSNSTTIGTTILNSYGGSDMFLAKYNSSGTFQWAEKGGGPGPDYGYGLAIDATGNIFVTGHFRSTATFGSVSLTTTAPIFSTFIVKYNSNGTALSGISVGGSGDCDGRGIGIDATGNLYISGLFTGNVSFGNINLTSSGTNNFFIAKYDASGTIVWAEREGKCLNWVYGNTIKTDASGNSYVYGLFSNIISFDGFTLTGSGTQSSFIVKYDNSGTALWANKVTDGYNRIFGISTDGLGNAFITGEFFDNTIFGNIILNTSYQNIFIAKVQNTTNLISGKVFVDYNNNALQDAGEPPYSSAIISYSPGNITTASNISGNYFMYSGTGFFNINIPVVPLNYTVSPVLHTANFTGLGQTDQNNNFALYPASLLNDLRVTLTNVTAARPGFDVIYYISYENIGTNTMTGSVALDYDSQFNYLPLSTNPAHTTYSSGTHTLTWDYLNLVPGEKRDIYVGFNLPSTVALGTSLFSVAIVNPVTGDNVPADNQNSLTQIVRGSYDPNDKSVSPAGNITPAQVATGEYLTYTIRFQNTGTDTVFTVIVADTLSSKLNIPTIEILSASHAYIFSVSGNGMLKWTFNNILLPDSTTNEPLSHGFIKYRIKPKNNLVIGDEIRNTAYIYFDYNEPVITNTTVTPVRNPGHILELNYRLQAMYPLSDSIDVIVRNPFPPFSIVDSCIKLPGSRDPEKSRATAVFNNLNNGSSYYIVIKHRNSIETWSSNPVLFSTDSVFYDFTTSLSQAYGNNMFFENGITSIYSGDVNQDGYVDLPDAMMIDNDARNIITGYVNTDLNGDGVVDISDMNLVESNSYNFVSKVTPETTLNP